MVKITVYDSPNPLGGFNIIVLVEGDNSTEVIEAYKLAKAQLKE